MEETRYDILYVCGAMDYGDSVSGSYILYKILKKLNLSMKVLPMFLKTKQTIDNGEFLLYFPPAAENLQSMINLIKYICDKFDSKYVNITMTHWMYGNGTAYPELDNSFTGDIIQKRADVYNSIDSHIIVGSTHSLNVHNKSLLANVSNVLIPFPFDEIEVDDSPKVIGNRKTILWGTTQPETPRKGKEYFEHILEYLYNMCDNPNEILIKTIGPHSQINTKFEVEYLGMIPNRKELSKIYKNVNVFALTTISDAGPMMATECVKNVTPLISFNTNIAMDFVNEGKNGYIVDNNEDYAKKLYEILYNNNFHMDLE